MKELAIKSNISIFRIDGYVLFALFMYLHSMIDIPVVRLLKWSRLILSCIQPINYLNFFVFFFLDLVTQPRTLLKSGDTSSQSNDLRTSCPY